MEIILSWLSLDKSMVEIMGYSLSYIEFIGTLTGLISVWLATRANIHTWTTGFVNITAFFIIYKQIEMYSDMLLQVFFFGASVLGLYQWLFKKKNDETKHITYMTNRSRILCAVSMVALTIGWGALMSRIHILLPQYFSEPAAYPYGDAFTTVLSIYATFLMAWKRVECWILWVMVDVVCVVLYFNRGVYFITIEYLIFLVMATMGLIEWIKEVNNEKRPGTGKIYACS